MSSLFNKSLFLISILLLVLIGLYTISNKSSEEKMRNQQYELEGSDKEYQRRIHSLLDTIVELNSSLGKDVSSNLLPPLSIDEIIKECSWYPDKIPLEVIALYTWSGGSKYHVEHPLWFRDNIFCTLDKAKEEYEITNKYYAPASGFKEVIDLLKFCFPIGSFEGSVYVIPTQGHYFKSSCKKPIISVFEGVDFFYDSLESMIRTQIALLKWEIDQLSNSSFNIEDVEKESEIIKSINKDFLSDSNF
ncbi:hypothetical protein [Flammeovirga sp. SJP92]|uniref:hypothetical protein n=1 Tax=Flammeovirga sp. SJP92 TaxID=1775430 RepID=UPI0007895F13|nr:hypothetical protein [Flammeovirga sp. SJP92]KXX69334.1 hypothetical protein AVL50_19775 [Flammeovirga sp. SJP92]